MTPDNGAYDNLLWPNGKEKRFCLPDEDPAHEAIVKAIAESFWGEGCYPFNAATGHLIQFESLRAAVAVESALIRMGRLTLAEPNPLESEKDKDQ